MKIGITSPVLDGASRRDLDSAESKMLRDSLVDDLVALGDASTPKVIEALRSVPRHAFVPGARLERAYANRPLDIGHEQTISQPSIVAVMTEALLLEGSERVLEIGTGSGYQAAILSLLAREVHSIERVEALADEARQRLVTLGYTNVDVHVGDGYAGWPSAAPFDRILLTAAPPEIPAALVEQLAEGGILVAPVGDFDQSLYRVRKQDGALVSEELGGVRFVPMLADTTAA